MEPAAVMTIEEAHALVSAAATKSPALMALVGYIERQYDMAVDGLTTLPVGRTMDEYQYLRGQKEAFQTAIAGALEVANQIIQQFEEAQKTD